ncbi:hypothetical protein I302_103049 [Kwoniella bestiolae CBS 10118]|uniref:Uncharacterized protein n=1 Tax=Kwoniella bestiolae CBS 10118 TaxID=1296100 RepID=A0A1B9GGS8_9TREE|nr:hypothetical protein I302_01745 [Kwoniella bestiolae CBS 10118]OCF30226.1 hypothetical protein I302_01745 [Kwoniella bestiolae CBS 10118]
MSDESSHAYVQECKRAPSPIAKPSPSFVGKWLRRVTGQSTNSSPATEPSDADLGEGWTEVISATRKNDSFSTDIDSAFSGTSPEEHYWENLETPEVIALGDEQLADEPSDEGLAHLSEAAKAAIHMLKSKAEDTKTDNTSAIVYLVAADLLGSKGAEDILRPQEFKTHVRSQYAKYCDSLEANHIYPSSDQYERCLHKAWAEFGSQFDSKVNYNHNETCRILQGRLENIANEITIATIKRYSSRGDQPYLALGPGDLVKHIFLTTNVSETGSEETLQQKGNWLVTQFSNKSLSRRS